MPLTITSPAFAADAAIPPIHTCEGDGESPELRWSGVPDDAVSLALIVDDPDAPDPAAPQRTFVHWVIYDIPPSSPGLQGDVRRHGVPTGAHEGTNDFGHTGYDGPCPPKGRHRYVHKLYALDTEIGDRGPLTKGELEQAMAGHVLDQAELVGTYQKGQH